MALKIREISLLMVFITNVHKVGATFNHSAIIAEETINVSENVATLHSKLFH